MRKLAFALIFLLCVGIAPIFACVPPTENPNATSTPTVDDYSQTAPVIFIGTVISSFETASRRQIVEIQVERYLKGSGFNIVQIDGYNYYCNTNWIDVGQQRIFLVQEYGNNGGIPLFLLIADAVLSDEARIMAITGESNAPQALPLDIQLTRIAENGDMNWVYIPLSILAALLGLVMVGLSLRRNRRKSKAKR